MCSKDRTYCPKQIGEPFHVFLIEGVEERRKTATSRIALLQEQRQLIDIELEVLGVKPINNPEGDKPSTVWLEKWQYSLVGFHNPKRHKGLSAADFISLYISRKGKFREDVKQRKQEAIEFVKRRFPNTLV
jgi:hypothetical protein